MKHLVKAALCLSSVCLVICFAAVVRAQAPAQRAEEKRMPLAIELPKPMFEGTPQNLNVPNLEKPLGRPRDPFLAYPDRKLEWDGVNLRVTNFEAANEFVKPQFREGWSL